MPSVAVVGASADRRKFGNKAVRAYLRRGWTVYPVNPRRAEVEGLPAFASARGLPGPVDRVVLYLPPDEGLAVLADIAALAPAEFMVNPGAESEELVAAARALGLRPLLTCAILEVGESPSTL